MNLLKKFFTVFIIMFLCLSPLGAIDLNQGDNSSHLTDLNDSSHLNELNGTDVEVESVNETDESINETDESIKGNDVEIQNLSINDTNSSKNLKLKKIDIEMQVDDTTYGEGAVVKIWIKNDGFGIAYNPKVIVEDKYTHEVYTKDYFLKGCNQIKLRNDLDPGTYTVTYEFSGSSYWESKTVTDNFTVNKKNPNLTASIEDVYVGEKPVVKVSSNEEIWGDGMTYSPQFTKDYNTHFSNGEASCTIDEDLPAGNYTCTVTYYGDFTHARKDVTVNFAVNKQDPNLTVQADNVTVNDLVPIKIRANESVNGEVKYIIKSRSGTSPIHGVYTVDMVNGFANDTLDLHLQPGKYSVSASFEGDNYFKESTAFSSFCVNEKPSPGLSVSIDDIGLGEKPVVKVSSNDDLEDDVIISSPQFSKDYNVNVQEGSGSCIVDEDLAAGNYTCTVSYPGDRKYGPENLTVNFAVNKHDPNLTVQVDDITVNNPISVKIRANESVNGEVTYLIKSRSKTDSIPITRTVKIVDGVANSTIDPYLQPGTYSISAYFEGDDCFKGSTAFSKFNVNKTT